VKGLEGMAKASSRKRIFWFEGKVAGFTRDEIFVHRFAGDGA
jgi:hypothetical protein